MTQSACSGSRRCARSPPTRSDRCARLSPASRTADGSPLWRIGARTGDTSGSRARGAHAKASAASRDDARKPLAHAHARARAGDIRFARLRRRRRMARAHGQQARRADGACARAPSSFSPRPRDLGSFGDARQSRGREARASRAPRRATRRAGRGAARQAADHRHAPAEGAGTLSLGRSPWRQNGRAGRGGDRSRDDDARLHQHAVAGGALVSAYSSPAAGMGRDPCDPSRLVVARDARLGRAGAEGRLAESGRLHIEPRPWRGFPARRAGDPDRLAQGRRAASAAGRAKRPRARPRLAHHARSHAHARARRGRRGPGRGREEKDREPAQPQRAAGCARPALRDRRARRRLPAGRSARRSARDRGLRASLGRELDLGARFHPPRRSEPHGLSRLPPRCARRERRLARGRPARGAAPQAEHRRDRERRLRHGAIRARRRGARSSARSRRASSRA